MWNWSLLDHVRPVWLIHSSVELFFIADEINSGALWRLFLCCQSVKHSLPLVPVGGRRCCDVCSPSSFFTSNTHTMVFKMTLFDTQAVTVHVNSIGGIENALSVLFLVTYVMIIPPPDQWSVVSLPLLPPQVDYSCRVPHAPGGFPDGCTRLSSEIWKL